MIAPLEYNTGDIVEWKKWQAEVTDIGGYNRNLTDIKYEIKYTKGKKEKTANVWGSKLKLIEKAKPAE